MKRTTNQTNEEPLLPQNTKRAVSQIVSNIKAMSDVVQRETDALIKSDTQTFLDLQEEKLLTASIYQRTIEEAIERKDEIKSSSATNRKKLEQMQKDFATLTRRNMEALQRMQRNTQRLGDVIRHAARDMAEKERTVNYNALGSIEEQQNKALSAGSISETV